jgi:hypothetical protein
MVLKIELEIPESQDEASSVGEKVRNLLVSNPYIINSDIVLDVDVDPNGPCLYVDVAKCHRQELSEVFAAIIDMAIEQCI